mmetsp:Transcript_740/g.1559  ORF Transcript_740/g.1559 Transcript_740/m.1559 type:complete len:201 (+) Transcript_740:2320-2922(+)
MAAPPREASTVRRVVANASGATLECSAARLAHMRGGKTSGRVEAHWPSLTNVGPASCSADVSTGYHASRRSSARRAQPIRRQPGSSAAHGANTAPSWRSRQQLCIRSTAMYRTWRTPTTKCCDTSRIICICGICCCCCAPSVYATPQPYADSAQSAPITRGIVVPMKSSPAALPLLATVLGATLPPGKTHPCQALNVAVL